MYFLFPIFLYHLQVTELEPLLVVGQARLEVLKTAEVQEVPEVVVLVGQREHQDHQRKFKSVEMDN